MKSIVLKLAGPLQSWGTSSNFETRHTDFYPSKSAIIGMIAASLGLKRNEDKEIGKLNNLLYAVRIDRQGQLLRDYHTARKHKENGQFDRTYVTNRYYLEDAVFTIAIGHQDESWIDEIEIALKNPYFQLFMGRRSLPLTADFFISSVYDNPIEALRATEWKASVIRSQDVEVKLPIYADTTLIKKGTKTFRRDFVISFSQKERKFGYRSESKVEMVVKIPTENTQHDAFDALGG